MKKLSDGPNLHSNVKSSTGLGPHRRRLTVRILWKKGILQSPCTVESAVQCDKQTCASQFQIHEAFLVDPPKLLS